MSTSNPFATTARKFTPSVPSDRGYGRGAARGRGPRKRASSKTPSEAGDSSAIGAQSSVVSGRGISSATRAGARGAKQTSFGRATTHPHQASRSPAGNTQRLNRPPSRLASQPVSKPPSLIDQSNAVVVEHNMEQVKARRDQLRKKMEQDKKHYIEQGLMADPDKPTTLEHAITPVGTCLEMCPENERVDRIYEMQWEPAETLISPISGKRVPVEARMVKKFRRAAAGIEEQLPSELRTPETLQKTLDYLIDEIIGGEDRLALHHKFVWDRTRAIRNDFSIQQVSEPEDVKIAVDCFERIARFHILSLHQLSNPDNLQDDDFFDAQQEREQLSKTLQSLEYYYNDHRGMITFPNEAEFKAYGALFELLSQTPDLEDRIADWPADFQNDLRTRLVIKIYDAATDVEFEQGPLRPAAPCSIAQSDAARFWTLLASRQVSYLMASVAEINFATIRFVALQNLWRVGKNAATTQQKSLRGVTLDATTKLLAFDDNEQTKDFCGSLDVKFVNTPGLPEYLDFTSNSDKDLDRSVVFKTKQVFSHGIVEQKRFRRTLSAVINGMSVAKAMEKGLVEDEEETSLMDVKATVSDNEDDSMFLPGDDEENPLLKPRASSNPFAKPNLNPQDASFTPGSSISDIPEPTPEPAKPSWMTNFGQPRNDLPVAGDPKISSIFAPKKQEQIASPFVSSSNATNIPQSSVEQSLTLTDGSKSVNTGNFNPFSGLASPSNSTTAAQVTPEQPVQSKSQAFSFTNSPPATAAAEVQPAQKQPIFSFTPTSTVTGPAAPAFNFINPQGLAPSSPTTTAIPSVSRSHTSDSHLQSTGQAPSASGPTFTFTKPPVTLPGATNAPAALIFSFTQPAVPTQALQSVHTDQPNRQETQEVSASPNRTSAVTSEPTQVPVIPFPFPQPANSQKTISLSSETSNIASVTSNTFVPRATPPVPSVKKATPKVTKDDLVRNLVKISLTQENGIIDMFVCHRLAHMLKDVFDGVKKDEAQAQIDNLKRRFLSRKYLRVWRIVCEQRRLQRRANRRRKMLAATVRATNEQRKRREEELEGIFEATQIKKQMQREQEERQKRQEEENNEDTTKPLTHAAATQKTPRRLPLPPAPVAGQKRKTPTNSISTRSLNVPATTPNHKRSRTLGNNTTNRPLRQSTSTSTFGGLGGHTTLRRSLSQHQLRKSASSERLDSTVTDYFRLKALGIELNEERKFAERQRAREQDLKQSQALNSVRKISLSQMSNDAQALPPVSRPLNPALDSKMTPMTPMTPATSASEIHQPTEDLFLRQLREARLALSSDTNWFRSQTSELEKELAAEDSFASKRNDHLRDAHIGSSTSSVNGFARSLSGHEYVTLHTEGDGMLSRTEERIRRTGAHGLANRPIGGSKKREAPKDYVSVAMSKSGSRAYLQSQAEAKGALGERPRFRGEEINQSEKTLPFSLVPDDTYRNSPSNHVTAPQRPHQNASKLYQTLLNQESDEEADAEEDETNGAEESEDEEDEGDDHAEPSFRAAMYTGKYALASEGLLDSEDEETEEAEEAEEGEDEDPDDEDVEEEDAGEEEEDEEDAPLYANGHFNQQYAAAAAVKSHSATPFSQGGGEDDPVELSD